MKLLRWGAAGAERPGLLDRDGRIRDLSGVVPDIAGLVLSEPGLAALRALDASRLPAVAGTPRLGCPVGGVGKVVAIGLNYADHAAEANMPLPKEPVVFMKAVTCLAGPDDPVPFPPGATKLDWEVELGVVIGSRARYVAEADALAHVAGYCVFNDVSERAWQLERGGQWMKGKSHDGFGPCGPWLVTRDEVPDPQALALGLSVNGRSFQRSNTAHMIFGVANVVAYVSRMMTLMPGDIIATGTPAGVGLGQKPQQVFLKPGDVMELEIERLGRQRQVVTAQEAG